MFVEHLEIPSIEAAEEVLPVDPEPAWVEAYSRYLRDGILPDDPAQARLLTLQEN